MSHDRHFLDRLVERVLEMDGGASRLAGYAVGVSCQEGPCRSCRRGFGKCGNSKLLTAAEDLTLRPKQKDLKRTEADILKEYFSQTKLFREICEQSEA